MDTPRRVLWRCFAGLGLGIMILAVAMKDDLIPPPYWDAIYYVGVGILMISTFICYFLEWLYDKNHEKKDR